MNSAALLLFVLLSPSVLALDNGLGLTPAMGWSSWNYFFYETNATLIMQIADAMVDLGLLDLGYEYVNIDAGYLLPGRDSNDQLIVDTKKYPDGIKAVADYVHSKGLKLGVYTDISLGSCGNGPGSYGYYDVDAKTFASWGVDYLKVDYCGTLGNLTEWDYWAELRDALNATGRPIYYSICPKTPAPDNGTAIPFIGQMVYSPPPDWTLAQHQTLANSLLVEYTNNVDNWYSPTTQNCTIAGPPPCGMITNVDAFVQMTSPLFSGPGSWNDCDMLELCNDGHTNGGMTTQEYMASYSIWAIFASPLILSADLRSVNSECLETIIKNKEVIAVDQDPLGSAGRLVYQVGNTSEDITEQVFVRNLSGGRFAAVLLNRGVSSLNMTISWEYLGVANSQSLNVRDLWLHQDVGAFVSKYVATVSGHGAVMVVLS